MDIKFWKNKKIFITGHTGFKGAWLCMILNHLGADVYGYSIDIPTTPSLFEVLQIKDLVKKDIRGDINDLALLSEEMKTAGPDIVIHLAAQSLVRKSYSSPIETYKTNVLGTLSVLEACRNTKSIKACLVITTDKCYENHEWAWGYRETDTLGGHDPYSSSKACAEIATKSFRESFLNENDIRVTTVRAGNVIGGGDWAQDRIVTDIVKSILNNEELILRNPNAIRPWQHVLEPLLAYLNIVELNFLNKLPSEKFNIGPNSDSEKSVGWIASAFYKSWGKEFKWQQDKKVNLHEAKFLKLDNSKIKSVVGWNPKLTIEETVEMTASWYKIFNEDHENIKAKTFEQINTLLEKV
jgi:CDP-glucose 4,6-dehydratase